MVATVATVEHVQSVPRLISYATRLVGSTWLMVTVSHANLMRAASTHRYYRVPLLKVSRLGKCTDEHSSSWQNQNCHNFVKKSV
jgi:hypothetical protein